MQTESEIERETDPKRIRILQGAMQVFLAYGYSRTTMDDIARAAEVSRPALYLLFKNKTDIYRAICSCLLCNSVREAREALAGDAPFAERVTEALDRALFNLIARIEGAPHGEELLDMKNSLAADILAQWRQDFGADLAAAIADEAGRREVDLPARQLSACGLADMLLDGLDGMKTRGVSCEDAAIRARELVSVIGLALRS